MPAAAAAVVVGLLAARLYARCSPSRWENHQRLKTLLNNNNNNNNKEKEEEAEAEEEEDQRSRY